MNGLDVVDEGRDLGAGFGLLAGRALVLLGLFALPDLLGTQVGQRRRLVLVVALAAQLHFFGWPTGKSSRLNKKRKDEFLDFALRIRK